MNPEARVRLYEMLSVANFFGMFIAVIYVVSVDGFRFSFFNPKLLAATVPFLVFGLWLNRARHNAFAETL